MAALGADFGLFLIGLAFASQSTVLPAFAVFLGAPNVVIGAIPAVMTAGWFLPSLFAASHTAALARRLPFVMRWTIWERVPLLVIALAAFVFAERRPPVSLAMMLGSLLAMSTVGGVLMPAWMDVVGRAIPTHVRGRFFAVTTALAAGGGLGASFVIAWVLGAISAPASYGVCFVIAAGFMALSYAALAGVREPPAAPTSVRTPLGEYLRAIPTLLRRDTNFARYLGARVFGVLGAMSIAFYTVYALRAYQAAPRHVGQFTTVLYAGQIAGTLAFGWLADRAGHRLVMTCGAVALVVANVVAILAPSLGWLTVVFACAGLNQAAINVSNLNILLEFAPTPDARPTYVGLGNTALGPVSFVAPLAAGLLADASGYVAVFAVAASAGVVATAMLAGVAEPRTRGA